LKKKIAEESKLEANSLSSEKPKEETKPTVEQKKAQFLHGD